MPEPVHKRREREVADLLGGERNPLSGSMSKHTAGDVISDVFFVEQKHRKQHTVWGLFDSVRMLARKEKRIPVITLTQSRKPGCLLVVHSDDLVAFCREVIKQHPESETVTTPR